MRKIHAPLNCPATLRAGGGAPVFARITQMITIKTTTTG